MEHTTLVLLRRVVAIQMIKLMLNSQRVVMGLLGAALALQLAAWNMALPPVTCMWPTYYKSSHYVTGR